MPTSPTPGRARRSYRGRFAPSPTGRLHAGSLAAALASWLDARAHSGAWILRIEDIDPPRDIPGAGESFIEDLARFGMTPDEPVVWQHDRYPAYEAALERLQAAGLVFGCACSRKEILAADARLGLPLGVYPGTCRAGTGGRAARSLRFRVPSGEVSFTDRWCGRFSQDVEHEVGDFVLRRADGLWAYQLAVVVDDMEEGITDVVRGADLVDNTPRQILLTRALGGEPPRYMHIPLVLNALGDKLSKQSGAEHVDVSHPTASLERAFGHLGFPRIGADSPEAFLRAALPLWAERFGG